MSLKPCKHLDYDGEYTDCVIRTCAPHFPAVRYWERGERWLDSDTNPKKVQFCKRRGRINGIFDCYDGSMGCYEPAGSGTEDGRNAKGGE